MIHLIDSNVYIHAFRDLAYGQSLREFHQQNVARVVLSAVVVHELLVGAANPTIKRSLQRWMVEPFRKRQRLHVPARQTWELAADIDLRLRRHKNMHPKLQSRSFGNDMLIAASARELGAVIVTENSADFGIIASVVDIRFAEPDEVFETGSRHA